MGEVVDLHSQLAHLEDDELIENLARFADGTLSEAAVKARHHLSNEEWAAMGENDRLIELVEAAKLRRIRTGATKRERAQIEIVDGPPILGKIMRDPGSNARHVIDAVKALDGLASNGAEAAAAGARFEITINLGADHVEHYSKSIAVDANDTDPNDIDAGGAAGARTNSGAGSAGGRKAAPLDSKQLDPAHHPRAGYLYLRPPPYPGSGERDQNSRNSGQARLARPHEAPQVRHQKVADRDRRLTSA